MINDHDPILDVLLAELLGGEQPPDLSARILRAYSDGHHSPVTNSPVSKGAVASAITLSDTNFHTIGCSADSLGIQALPADLLTKPVPREICGSPAARLTSWWAAAAAMLLVAVGIGGWWIAARNQGGLQGIPVASPGASPNASPSTSRLPRDQKPSNALASNARDERAASHGEGNGTRSVPATTDDLPANGSVAVSPRNDGSLDPADPTAADNLPKNNDQQPDNRATTGGGATLAASVVALPDDQILAAIDQHIGRAWADAGVRPSPPAPDDEWCRRVYLDVIGRIPAIAELEEFLTDRGTDKRERLVDRLLGLADSSRAQSAHGLSAHGLSAQSADVDEGEAYARHWTIVWTNLLIGRSGGMLPGTIDRPGMQQFLRRSFLANKPYNQMVHELLAAEGAAVPGQDDSNGAVNFLLDNTEDQATSATAKTAQIFLGVQVQCTQCHNHPFNDWQQNQFWELNAFFRQMQGVREIRPGVGEVLRLTSVDFPGEGANADIAEAPIFYELRNGEMRVAYPRFLDGTSISSDGRVSVVNRRRELAGLVTRSELFAQAAVNRMWAHFFGYGFTRPIDDMGPHNPPSHPELLHELSQQFVAHGYDLKSLIRWVVLSRPYSLSSKFGKRQGNLADDPGLGTAPVFSHFYLRQMTAEQLYESLLVATEAHQAQPDYAQRELIRSQWLQQFTMAFDTDENTEATTFDGTITQTLMMMNGELIRQATSTQEGTFLARMARGAAKHPDPRKGSPVHSLYLAALGRRPSPHELQWADALFSQRLDDGTTALEDMWWALLNSNEFILNH